MSGRNVKKFRVMVEHVIETCCAEDARAAALEGGFARRVISVEEEKSWVKNKA